MNKLNRLNKINELNSYKNKRKCIDRLKAEYKKHKNLIIGFDFDNTIYDYHNDNLHLQDIIDILKRCCELNFTMCLYTIPDRLSFKKKYCKEIGVKYDYVNSSPIMENPSKPYFNILLDDRAGLMSSYEILKQVINELKL